MLDHPPNGSPVHSAQLADLRDRNVTAWSRRICPTIVALRGSSVHRSNMVRTVGLREPAQTIFAMPQFRALLSAIEIA
jgi:hypothetical protein